jgi:2',3'-cyclic-nucleotide 2'-phosphodiesterase (5'-nucleotidase family)
LGGLSKKAFQFASLSKEKSLPLLIVDGGSVLFKTDSVAGNQEDQAKITAAGIVKAYSLIGYDAVGVSSRDLAAGLDFLLKTKETAKFDWLSANIVKTNNGEPLFKPAISRQVGDIRIGIIGLTNHLPPGSELLGQDTEIKAWQDILPELMARLTRDHDFIILLTSLAAGECRAIAELYPAINLIVLAKNSDAGLPPRYLTDATVQVSTGGKGKYIGMMTVNWHPGGKWRPANPGILSDKKEERERLNRQLALIKDRPGLNDKKLRDRLQEITATIEKLEQEKESSAKEARPASSLKNRFMAMERAMPDHPAVLQVVNETKQLLNKLGKKSAATPIISKSATGFVGWRQCRECHGAQVANWQKTGHAASFQALLEKKQQFNLDCLPCHVTGVAPNDPAAAIGRPKDLQMVGCESCHGAGGRHSDNPASSKLTPITEKICLNCHRPEHDESFDFARDIKKLNCTH